MPQPMQPFPVLASVSPSLRIYKDSAVEFLPLQIAKVSLVGDSLGNVSGQGTWRLLARRDRISHYGIAVGHKSMFKNFVRGSGADFGNRGLPRMAQYLSMLALSSATISLADS